MRTILCWRFFEFRARREESADLARNRDSRRSRTPLAAESMNAKNANIEGSALLPGTRWCKKKIAAISFEEGVVFRARVLARTLLYVFLVTSTFYCWFFSNYVEDCIVQYTYNYSTLIEYFRKYDTTYYFRAYFRKYFPEVLSYNLLPYEDTVRYSTSDYNVEYFRKYNY